MTHRLALVAAALGALGAAACSDDLPNADSGPDGGVVADAAAADRAVSDGGGCPTTVTPRPGTVITQSGAVTGVRAAGTWSWKGIPFAAPPTGTLRFRPPQPAACWSGELQAASFGSICPQRDSKTQEVVGDEDCLSLNVWAKEGASDAPVLVFVHGGGNTVGGASFAAGDSALQGVYDGTELAARTGAVVVTVQYRLGALGFLAAAALNAESPDGVSGNYGILDQIAALKWVQANIAGFGGAPQRVLLFGESAGAQNTLVHVASPLAKGLFAAAIVESGGTYRTTLAEAIAVLQPLIETVGCGGASDVPACLRAKPAAELVKVPSAIGPLEKGLRYSPVVDGHVLADTVTAVIERGAHNHVPIILGTNAHETSRMVPQVTTDAEYQAAVRALYPVPALAEAALAQYPSAAYASPRQALIALTTDATWTCPIRRLARALAAQQSEPVYRYYFSWTAPGLAGAAIGATHGLELPFVFRTFSALSEGFTPAADDLALSEAIQGYWSRLAADGDPNGGGAVSWPRYDVATDPYLELGKKIAAGAGLATANCDLIDSLVK